MELGGAAARGGGGGVEGGGAGGEVDRNDETPFRILVHNGGLDWKIGKATGPLRACSKALTIIQAKLRQQRIQ